MQFQKVEYIFSKLDGKLQMAQNAPKPSKLKNPSHVSIQ